MVGMGELHLADVPTGVVSQPQQGVQRGPCIAADGHVVIGWLPAGAISHPFESSFGLMVGADNIVEVERTPMLQRWHQLAHHRNGRTRH